MMLAYEFTESIDKLISGRWLEIEPYMLNSIELSYFYAKNVVKGKWPEAEQVIIESKNVKWMLIYAVLVIRDAWPEAEPYIMADDKCGDQYLKHVDVSTKFYRAKIESTTNV